MALIFCHEKAKPKIPNSRDKFKASKKKTEDEASIDFVDYSEIFDNFAV